MLLSCHLLLDLLSTCQSFRFNIKQKGVRRRYLKRRDEEGRLKIDAFPDPLDHVVEVGDAEEQRRHQDGPLRRVVAEQDGQHTSPES